MTKQHKRWALYAGIGAALLVGFGALWVHNGIFNNSIGPGPGDF